MLYKKHEEHILIKEFLLEVGGGVSLEGGGGVVAKYRISAVNALECLTNPRISRHTGLYITGVPLPGGCTNPGAYLKIA